MPEAYPLHWPEGWPRTPPHRRVWGPFKVTPDKARRELLEQIRLLGGSYPLISSDVAVRKDGQPYADAARRQIRDPGVAIYFALQGKQMVFACDRYDAPYKNLRAISKTIEAIRGIERWGSSQMMERAFTAFEALPAPGDWRQELGGRLATMDDVRRRYRELVKTHHPDDAGHKIAERQMSSFGGMPSFIVAGGAETAMRVAGALKIVTRATSLGGTHTLIEHRASIEGAGTKAPQGLLRMSIGLEHPDDIIEDLRNALDIAITA